MSICSCYASESSAECLRALVPLVADAIPSSKDFVAIICPSKIAEGAFRYDRANHYTHVARTVAAGEIVSRYPEFGVEMVRPGQRLALVVAQGPVRVVETVEALQPARSGERLFVKTHDGQILSARYESAVR
jgi:hypothetical protein